MEYSTPRPSAISRLKFESPTTYIFATIFEKVPFYLFLRTSRLIIQLSIIYWNGISTVNYHFPILRYSVRQVFYLKIYQCKGIFNFGEARAASRRRKKRQSEVGMEGGLFPHCGSQRGARAASSNHPVLKSERSQQLIIISYSCAALPCLIYKKYVNVQVFLIYVWRGFFPPPLSEPPIRESWNSESPVTKRGEFTTHCEFYIFNSQELMTRTGVQGSCSVDIDRRMIAWRYERVRAENAMEGERVDVLPRNGDGRLAVWISALAACHRRVKVIFMRMSQDLYSGEGHAEMDSRGYARRFNTQ